MSQSIFISKFSRLALLSVFCAGLFLMSGEVNMNNKTVQIGGVVYAADPATTPEATKKSPIDETINSLVSLLNVGIGLLTFLITPLIMLAGWLLSPDWTFGEVFGLRPIFHQLWILISNVVYVIFGFMLVFVAFANIFGGEHAKAYEMKTMLPKLVTGMLMVPFTWFIVSATLSVVNILTASVIQLPASTIGKVGGIQAAFLTDPIIPKNIIYNKSVDPKSAGKENVSSGEGKDAVVSNGNFSASDCTKSKENCISIEKFLTGGGGGAYNLLSVYAYGIFRIQGYKDITPAQGINAILDIVTKLGFGIIFFVIFGILVIAIVYALFTRAIMLWMYAIFSPLFALLYVTGSKHKSLEKFSIKEFISLAMVPVYVSAALAFGLMFLGAVMNSGAANGKVTSDIVSVESQDTTTTFKFLGENGVSLKTIGLLDPQASGGAKKALNTGTGIIGTIIVNTLALVILWMAVMAALGASKITEAAVKPISDMGNSVGELMKHAPQYIPIPGTNGQSMKSVTQGVSNVRGGIEQAASTKANEITRKFGLEDAAKRNQVIADLSKAITQKDPKNMTQKFHELKNTYSSYDEFLKDGRAQEMVRKMGGELKVDDNLLKAELSNVDAMTRALNALDEKLKTKGSELFDKDGFGDDSGYVRGQFIKKSTTPTTPSPVIPAIPPAVGTTHTPVINATTITVTGTAPVTTLGTGAARTITAAQFDAIRTASGIAEADLKTQLTGAHITVVG